MPVEKLDLSLALKLIDKFDGTPSQLSHFIETVEILKEYSENVPESALVRFLKTRLIGAAHGAIDGLNTVEAAVIALKNKFAIRLTVKAVESEIKMIKQKNMSVTDYGAEMDKLCAKLAAAHVSQDTFASESAAGPVVQPVVVDAFIEGLKDQQTQFLVKARNPKTLNEAISHALEMAPKEKSEQVLWFNPGYQRPRSYQGRGQTRPYRGQTRGRFNGHQSRGGYQQRNNPSPNNNFPQHRGGNRGTSSFRGSRGNNNRTERANTAEEPAGSRRCNCRNSDNEEEEVRVASEFFRDQ